MVEKLEPQQTPGQETPEQVEVLKQSREVAKDGEVDSLQVEKERTIKDAKLLEGGAHYELDEKGNRILVLSERQIEDQKRAERRKKDLSDKADKLLKELKSEESKTMSGYIIWTANGVQLYPNNVEALGDQLAEFGCDEQAGKLYEKAIEMEVNKKDWAPKTEEDKKLIFDYSKLNAKRNLAKLLEKSGRKDEANLARITIADENLRQAESAFRRRLASIRELQRGHGYYDALIKDGIRSEIMGQSGDWFIVAMKLYQEAGDQKGIEKTLEAEKRYAEAEKKEYEKGR